MTKKTLRKEIPRDDGARYARVADGFHRAAELALEHDYRGAAGLLFVHAGIAYADAVCIARRGVRSSSERHQDALTLLREAAGSAPGGDAALGHLRHLLDEKSRLAYTGDEPTAAEAAALAKHAARFRDWASGLIGR